MILQPIIENAYLHAFPEGFIDPDFLASVNGKA